MRPVLHNYLERGAGGFANISLATGERIFVSIAASGLRVHRLWFSGRLPGRRLFVADAALLQRIVRVVGRDLDRLPELPKEAALQAFAAGAAQAIADPDVYRRQPLEDEVPVTTLALLTRLALADPDAAAYVRRLGRAAVTP